jgi:hypothetical protein
MTTSRQEGLDGEGFHGRSKGKRQQLEPTMENQVTNKQQDSRK